MSIQFNKVTWYSKLLAVIVLIATVIFSFYIRGEYNKIESSFPSPGVAVSPTGDIALVVGKSAAFDGLEISFDKVTKDNRCPVEVRCFVAGAVTAQVILRSAGKVQKADLISDGIIYRFANYAISIKHVTPIRHVQVEIDPQNYLVIFHVTNTLGV